MALYQTFSNWLEQKVIVPVQSANQKGTYDCGPGALRAISKLFGRDEDQEELKDMTDAGKRKGTHPEDLVKTARRLGMKAVAKEGMTLKMLLKQIKAGRPVICAIQAHAKEGDKHEYKQLKHGHYLTAMGFDLRKKMIYFEDPSIKNGKRGKLRFNDFMKRWYDKEAYTEDPLKPHLGIVIWDDVQVDPEYKTKAEKIP